MHRPPLPNLWRVPVALACIRALLAKHPDGGELATFLPAIAADAPDRTLQARAALASTPVAGLELARERVLSLEQAENFGTVTMVSATVWEEGGATAA